MPEILYALQDLCEYLRVSRRRNALRQPGQGIDYGAPGTTVQEIVSRIHPRRMRLRVREVIQETPTTKTFRLERLDGPMPPFRAGQYVNVFVDVDGVLTSRPYSIASPPTSPLQGSTSTSSPSGPTFTSPPPGPTATSPPLAGGTEGGAHLLDLTVRDKPDGFVAPYLLNEIQVGDELETTGPAGTFYHEPLIDGDDLVFLAGGSGITPFMSIIRDAVQRDPSLKIHLLYGSRVPDDVIYGDELAALAAKHPNLQVTLVVSEPPEGYRGQTGFLNAELIHQQVGDTAGKTFYVCGPNVMYGFCLDALTELGVPRHKIKRELYGPPADVTREPGWPEGLVEDTRFRVEIVGRDAVQAPAGEPLLNSLERHGIIVPAVCRAGACSACRVQLVAGQVFQPASAALRESDRLHGYIHACVSYPLEDLSIRL